MFPQNCAICGDRATGKHYGAASCESSNGLNELEKLETSEENPIAYPSCDRIGLSIFTTFPPCLIQSVNTVYRPYVKVSITIVFPDRPVFMLLMIIIVFVTLD